MFIRLVASACFRRLVVVWALVRSGCLFFRLCVRRAAWNRFFLVGVSRVYMDFCSCVKALAFALFELFLLFGLFVFWFGSSVICVFFAFAFVNVHAIRVNAQSLLLIVVFRATKPFHRFWKCAWRFVFGKLPLL